jgi:hypothetical protein
MSKLYELTKQIHEILPQVEQKYEIKTNIHLYSLAIFKNGAILPNHGLNGSFLSYFGAPQILQILTDLQEILDKNPHWERVSEEREELNPHYHYTSNSSYGVWEAYQAGQLDMLLTFTPKSTAEVLCNRWLDGLDPLFNRQPEMVLQELLNVLENLIK